MIYILIFLSKVIESALSTLRLILVANGKKLLGAILQMFVTIVWIITASIVIIDIKNDYFKAIAFILGSTIGSYIGSLIEQYIAMGNNMLICIVNPKLKERIKKVLKEKNYKIVEINDDCKLAVLTKRKNKNNIKKIVKEIDKNSTIIIEKVLFE